MVDFYDKLLYYWDQLELYHEIVKNAETSFNFRRAMYMRELYRFLLEKELGVVCNGVYGS